MRLDSDAMRLSNVMRLNDIIRLGDVMRLGGNAIRLGNIIRLNNIMRLSNIMRLKAGQQRKDLRLLSHYRKIIVVNKWLLFKAAIGQKDKVLFHSWERLYIYNISGYVIIVYSVKRFSIKMTLYGNGFSKLFWLWEDPFIYQSGFGIIKMVYIYNLLVERIRFNRNC